MLNVIEQLTLAVAANAGKDFDTLALIELQSELFGSEASGSVLGIWGYDNFDSTDDYSGQFTSYSGYVHHVKGTFSYSDTCWAVAVGGTTGSSWSLSFGETFYIEIYSGALFPVAGNRGGGLSRETFGNSRFSASYYH